MPIKRAVSITSDNVSRNSYIEQLFQIPALYHFIDVDMEEQLYFFSILHTYIDKLTPFNRISVLYFRERYIVIACIVPKQKQKYRGMFKTQKSRNKISSGDIGLIIRTLASPKVGQDQVSGGVSVLCWHAAPVANVLWKPLAIRYKVKFGYKVKISNRVKHWRNA